MKYQKPLRDSPRSIRRVSLVAIAFFLVWIAGCSGNGDTDVDKADQQLPPPIEKVTEIPSLNRLSGNWEVNQTVEISKSDGALDCLIAEVTFSRIRTMAASSLRLSGDLIFTCVGVKVTEPPTWRRLIPDQTYIVDSSNTRLNYKESSGIFARDVERPELGKTWEGWIDFEIPMVTYGSYDLFLSSNDPPIPISISAPPPATPQPKAPPLPTPEPRCKLDEPCVGFWFSTDETTVGSEVEIGLSILPSPNNPPLTVQLSITIPSGWAAVENGTSQGCDVICFAEYKNVSSGRLRPLSFTAIPNQPGSVIFEGRVVWFFEGEEEDCPPRACGQLVKHPVDVLE